MARTVSIFTCLAMILAGLPGCGPKGPAPYPDWRLEADTDAKGAFADYVEAGLQVQKEVGKVADRKDYFDTQRQLIMGATNRVEPLLRRASMQPIDFTSEKLGPFEPSPRREGWRLIGLGLQYATMLAIKEKDFDKAIRLTILASRFGYDLTGGDTLDATIGYAIAGGCRQVMAPVLDDLSDAQLTTLENGLRGAIGRIQPLRVTMAHERVKMRIAIQYLQDQYRINEFDGMHAMLGPTTREAIDYLRELRAKDHSERPRYFAGFVAEADSEVDRVNSWGVRPANRRPTEKELNEEDRKAKYRPWKRFASQLLRGPRHFLPIRDRALAQVRLFAQEARLTLLARRGQLPDTLPKDDPFLTTDPFSGEPFKYSSRTGYYDLYSLGANMLDDSGLTNSSYTMPDLRLERPR